MYSLILKFCRLPNGSNKNFKTVQTFPKHFDYITDKVETTTYR